MENIPTFFVFFTNSAQWEGRIVRASTKEKINANIATVGIIERKIPSAPSANNIGNNEAIFVNTVAITGHATSCAPIIAALAGSIPFWIYLFMFSTTIIASSTTIPSTIIRPNMVITFKVFPVYCININAPKKATGKPSAARKADLKSKNKANTISTAAIPKSPVFTIESNLPFTQ